MDSLPLHSGTLVAVVLLQELSLSTPSSSLGKNKLCLLINGTTRSVPLAKVNIDCPFFKGEAEAMVMPMPIYDLIIIPGAREPDNPDVSWRPTEQHEEGHGVVVQHQQPESRMDNLDILPQEKSVVSTSGKTSIPRGLLRSAAFKVPDRCARSGIWEAPHWKPYSLRNRGRHLFPSHSHVG